MRPRHRAILRAAALMVPREQRGEWWLEWTAELWYVQRANRTAFCLGAFKDAFWLRRNSPPSFRLESPVYCMFFLALLAAACLAMSLPLPVEHSRVAGNVVTVAPMGHRGSSIRFGEFQSWNNDRQRVFTGLAFYRPMLERVAVGGHRHVELSIARASDNLFQMLNVPVAAVRPGMRALIISHAAWREFFDGDPHIAGRVLEVAGGRAVVAGIIAEESWRLPSRIDAWLLEDPREAAGVPIDARGFVIARVRKPTTQRMFVANDSGGHDDFDCIPVGRDYHPLAGFLLVIAMSGLLLPATTSLSLGEYPAKSGLRRWIFLAGKLALILVMVYCGALQVAYKGVPVHGLLVGCILAFRWAVVDQRQRCPVCLRLLTNPVRVGQPSQTFLEWYGTEFICSRGHGFLHVPEIATSCYGAQRWLRLHGSWRGL